MAVAVVLAVGLVVLVLVGDEVGEREAVMRGEEVDAARRRAPSRPKMSDEPASRVASAPSMCASPRQKRADVVAVAVVPFEEVRAGNGRAGSRPDRCPRARRSARGRPAPGRRAIAASSGASGSKPSRVAPEDRREVEAEAVDAGLRRRNGAACRGPAAAPTGWSQASVLPVPVSLTSVPSSARGGSRRARRARAATASGRSASLSPVWLKTTSRITPMPAARSAATVSRSSAMPPGAQARIERHEGDRIVAPGIGEPERRQMALVDPGGDRHQLDRVDAELLEMLDDRRVGQRGDRAAQRPPAPSGWQHGEGAHVEFVDQPAGREQRRLRRSRLGQRDRRSPWASAARCRRPRRGAPTAAGRRRRAGRSRRIGIDQQLVGIEPEAALRLIGAVGAQAVARAGARARARTARTRRRRSASARAGRSRGRPRRRRGETQMRSAAARPDGEVRRRRGRRVAPSFGAVTRPARCASGDDARLVAAGAAADAGDVVGGARSGRQAPPACRGRAVAGSGS